MANEKLVSSIYFRGGKVSSSELDVIDTSLPATYEISIINNDGHVIPDALDIQVGLTTAVLARQVPKRNDVPKFWYGLTGAAASKFDLYTGGGGKQPLLGEVSVPTNALVIFSLQVNHYPSLVDLDATLDLYHDAARTQKFASIPIRSKAVTGVSLRLTTMRNLSNQPEVEPLGIYNNDVLVVHYTDPNINRSNYVIIPFKTKINGVDVPAGFYPPGGASWLVDQWYNDVRGYGTSGEFSVIASRQKNPTVSGNVVIEVTMGDLIVTNTLVDVAVNFIFKPVNIPNGNWTVYIGAGSPIVGLSYGAGTVIKGSSKVSNYGMKIFAVMANHNANRTGFTYGIQVDFFNFPIGESSLDDVTIKPTTVFAQVNNGIKHELTRWTFDGDPVTGSRQRYIFQGANATTTNLDAWLDDFTANIGKETNFTVSLF